MTMLQCLVLLKGWWAILTCRAGFIHRLAVAGDDYRRARSGAVLVHWTLPDGGAAVRADVGWVPAALVIFRALCRLRCLAF
jgi:hypothetical protein